MSGIPLIQGGEGTRDQTTAQEMLTAVVICGLLIVLAAPLVQWITGYTDKTVSVDVNGGSEDRTYWTDDPDKISDGMTESEILEHAVPSEVSTVFDKVIMGVRAIAAFVMIIALVWGGIKLRARKLPNLISHQHGER